MRVNIPKEFVKCLKSVLVVGEKQNSAVVNSLVSASWHQSGGVAVTRGRSRNVLAGAWRKRKARGQKSVGNQAALVLLVV